jgi:amino acid transporter
MSAVLGKIKRVIVGAPRNIRDPRIFHKVSLIALSSSYGPQELYLALGTHVHLAIFLAIATAATVLIISFSYMQIIEHFPSGGGGYLVATKLLGPYPGVISGSALLVDYILTISISISAGCDAIFSFLPPVWHIYKFPAIVFALVLLIILNLRGIRESVTILFPIFATFVVTHIILIGFGIFAHLDNIPAVSGRISSGLQSSMHELGLFGVLFLAMRAFSMGAGTYTGIEAVSNGLQIMREPRVVTGKRTMVLLSVSLAVTASGIIISYLLNNVYYVEGQTLNAVLANIVMGPFNTRILPLGDWLVVLTLVSEGGLLFVAAQAGFLDGPRVLANMAIDSWVPHRFANLSERLVTKNGVWFMGLASFLILLYCQGDIGFLVILYAINVFITFSLSQLGMVRFWFGERKAGRPYFRKMLINLAGLILCLTILTVTVAEKFTEGGWLTIIITSCFIITAFIIKGHYKRVNRRLRKLDDLLTHIPTRKGKVPREPLDRHDPTVVILVAGFNGQGMHTLLQLPRIFPQGYIKNIIFISVALIDSANFKGASEVASLEEHTRMALYRYMIYARKLGYRSDCRYLVDTEIIPGILKISKEIAAEFPRVIFFSSRLVFKNETFFTHLLHNETPFAVQRALQFEGLQAMILPIRYYY